MNERFRRGLGTGFVIGVLGYIATGKIDVGKFFKKPEVAPQRKLNLQVVEYLIETDRRGIILTSPMYKDKEEFDDWIASYRAQYKPTGLKITSTVEKVDTPDGPMSTTILVWRASWTGDELKNRPIITIGS